jgi:D-xylose transport system permease protein
VYAVGRNEEASLRAGVVVSRIRISVFVICSGMAAVSGMIAAFLLQSEQSNAGAGNTLLLAVGAAVIGAPRCSADTAALATPFSAAWSSRSSSTA